MAGGISMSTIHVNSFAIGFFGGDDGGAVGGSSRGTRVNRVNRRWRLGRPQTFACLASLHVFACIHY